AANRIGSILKLGCKSLYIVTLSIDTIVISVVETATYIYVFKPAGLLLDVLSQPIKNPKTPLKIILKRSEEHTSELQSRFDLVCRLLLEKKKLRSKSISLE